MRVQARDTTGCGDSFMGTILAGLSSGMTLMDSAQLASYVSAYAAHQLRRTGLLRHRGADPRGLRVS